MFVIIMFILIFLVYGIFLITFLVCFRLRQGFDGQASTRLLIHRLILLFQSLDAHVQIVRFIHQVF